MGRNIVAVLTLLIGSLVVAGCGSSPTAPTELAVTLSVSGQQTQGSVLTFTATVTNPPASMTFAWDYGNFAETMTSASPKSVNHIYNVPGDYTTTVKVTAPDGRTATKSLNVTIS